MTYAEAIRNGYKDSRTAYQRGYVSRKVNIDDQPVLTSGRGEAYVLLPARNTTRYCVRQYLSK